VADTVRDGVEELSHWLFRQVLLRDVGGRHPGHALAAAAAEELVRALRDHAVTLAAEAVTGRAVDAEAIAAAIDRLLGERDLLREGGHEILAALAGVERVVVAELTEGDRALDLRPLGALVGEERISPLRLVLGLRIHVLDQVDARLARGRGARLGG